MRRWLISLIAICLVLVAAAGWLFMRLHNGVKVKPAADYAVGEHIVQYRQDDEEWAEDFLGGSSYKMKTSGCLVSCIAAARSMNGERITPGELNTKLSENAVFDTEGNLQWDMLKQMDSYYVEVFGEVSNESIEKCLENGKYPTVRVRRHGVGALHYVLIVGAKDGEYLCMDPLEDELTNLSDYGSLVYAIRCVWFGMKE